MDAEEEVDQQGQKRARSGDESDGGEDDAAAGSPGSPDGDGDLATPRGRKGARGAAPDSPGGGGDDDEGEGEDLFEDDERDYRAIPELDAYDPNLVDGRDFGVMDMDARRRAEEELRDRDREEGRFTSRLPIALQEDDDDGDDLGRPSRRRRIARQAADGVQYEEEEDGPFALDEFAGMPLRQWIENPRTAREIKKRFKHFLKTYNDEYGNNVYNERIVQMCSANLQSLEVSYIHLSREAPILAIWVADAPKGMLKHFHEVAQEAVLEEFEDYAAIHDEVWVRVTDLPVSDSLRDLRHIHLNALIKVSGVCTRRTGVFPQLKMVKYDCPKCGHTCGPYPQNDTGGPTGPPMCPDPDCQSKGPFVINSDQTVYRNYQRLTIQEAPGTVPAGRVPRNKIIILVGDLIDNCAPGEEVEITGIYTHQFDMSLNTQQGFPVFSTVIEANYVQKRESVLHNDDITEEDIRRIRRLAQDPNIGARIIESLAPSIYGNEHVKTAVAMSMFGGQEKNIKNKHRIRGDINVLLLGDPGTAKSQVLKYIEKTSPRVVYTTGKGASAVGLTAAVHKDPITKEWTLEGGALVLADRGTCLIDEFDKMNDSDRTSIHEAMEQQSISISKAGIVTSLQARCSIVAAANPIGGRYDPQRTFSENVELTDPILSRFDILCVLQDEVDPVRDERLARFVVGSHIRSHPSYDPEDEEEEEEEEGSGGGGEGGGAGGGAGGALGEGGNADDDNALARGTDLADRASDGAGGSGGAGGGGGGGEEGAMVVTQPTAEKQTGIVNADGRVTIDQELLRKYLRYARKHVKPQLLNIDQDKVTNMYAEMRRESITCGGIPIAVRHIESIMRMSEASAKMHLRDFVRDDDVDMAIRVMLESFIHAQKFQVMRPLRRKFRRYLVFKKQNNVLLMHVLQTLVRDEMAFADLQRRHRGAIDGSGEEDVEVRVEDLESKARDMEIYDIKPFTDSEMFEEHGFSLDQAKGIIRKSFMG